jgi:5-methyltetrahydrofolate--homocysteine methyltransferase
MREQNPSVVSMSALPTTTVVNMQAIILALQEAGLRVQITVMVDDAPVSAACAEEIGADAYAPYAAGAVDCVRGRLA